MRENNDEVCLADTSNNLLKRRAFTILATLFL